MMCKDVDRRFHSWHTLIKRIKAALKDRTHGSRTAETLKTQAHELRRPVKTGNNSKIVLAVFGLAAILILMLGTLGILVINRENATPNVVMPKRRINPDYLQKTLKAFVANAQKDSTRAEHYASLTLDLKRETDDVNQRATIDAYATRIRSLVPSRTATAQPTAITSRKVDGPTITRLILVEAPGGTPIRPLKHGNEIKLDKRDAVSLLAETSGGVDQVEFFWGESRRTETHRPFLISGDHGSTYNPWPLKQGEWSVKVTPYSKGEEGTPFIIHVKIED